MSPESLEYLDLLSVYNTMVYRFRNSSHCIFYPEIHVHGCILRQPKYHWKNVRLGLPESVKWAKYESMKLLLTSIDCPDKKTIWINKPLFIQVYNQYTHACEIYWVEISTTKYQSNYHFQQDIPLN